MCYSCQLIRRSVLVPARPAVGTHRDCPQAPWPRAAMAQGGGEAWGLSGGSPRRVGVGGPGSGDPTNRSTCSACQSTQFQVNYWVLQTWTVRREQ